MGAVKFVGTQDIGGAYEVRASGVPAGAHYCYHLGTNNTATRAEVVFYDVATGWTRQSAKMAADPHGSTQSLAASFEVAAATSPTAVRGQ